MTNALNKSPESDEINDEKIMDGETGSGPSRKSRKGWVEDEQQLSSNASPLHPSATRTAAIDLNEDGP
jgi:hypothetical protein